MSRIQAGVSYSLFTCLVGGVNKLLQHTQPVDYHVCTMWSLLKQSLLIMSEPLTALMLQSLIAHFYTGTHPVLVIMVACCSISEDHYTLQMFFLETDVLTFFSQHSKLRDMVWL